MKFRKSVFICLSALLVLATGCSAPSGAANSESNTIPNIQSSESSSESSSYASSEASSSQSVVSEPTHSNSASSEKSTLKNASSVPKVSSKKPQNNNEWVAYIDDNQNLRIKKQDGSNDKAIVKEVAEAPCVAGEWVYYLPDLDEIDKVKLDGSQKTKVCGTDALIVYNANVNKYHGLNGSTSVTAEYKDGYVLYTCFQLHEVGDKPNPPSYYKLDPNTNEITAVKG